MQDYVGGIYMFSDFMFRSVSYNEKKKVLALLSLSKKTKMNTFVYTKSGIIWDNS